MRRVRGSVCVLVEDCGGGGGGRYPSEEVCMHLARGQGILRDSEIE